MGKLRTSMAMFYSYFMLFWHNKRVTGSSNKPTSYFIRFFHIFSGFSWLFRGFFPYFPPGEVRPTSCSSSLSAHSRKGERERSRLRCRQLMGSGKGHRVTKWRTVWELEKGHRNSGLTNYEWDFIGFNGSLHICRKSPCYQWAKQL